MNLLNTSDKMLTENTAKAQHVVALYSSYEPGLSVYTGAMSYEEGILLLQQLWEEKYNEILASNPSKTVLDEEETYHEDAYAQIQYLDGDVLRFFLTTTIEVDVSKAEKKLKAVLEAVDKAVMLYDPNEIDVVLNEETGMLDIMWHSHNNSFAVNSSIEKLESIDKEALITGLDKKGVGYVI